MRKEIGIDAIILGCTDCKLNSTSKVEYFDGSNSFDSNEELLIMNIEIMNDHIRYFYREIIESGFKRDIDDYLSSIPTHHDNIITLRDIATRVLNVLEQIYQSDLPEALKIILPKESPRPFTETPFEKTMRDLVNDTQIELTQFYTQLSSCLTTLQTQIKENQLELDKVQEFIAPYISEDTERMAKDDVAIISIVFKDDATIKSLRNFSQALVQWNKTLPIYHQLLKSSGPEDVQVLEVQNGSIDFIVNMDIDIALDLVQLFKIGFKVFTAYLAYKSTVKLIVECYYGDRILINSEKEREKHLLDNIGKAIKREIKAQHDAARKRDKQVDHTAVTMKVKQVTELVTSHIVKGNDFRLLALPEKDEPENGENVKPDEREQLRKQSMKARQQLRLLPIEEKQKLLEV